MLPLLILFSFSLLFGSEHYAKFEPLSSATIKASASGKIVEANLSSEGRYIRDSKIIQIDDYLDRLDLNRTLESVKLLRDDLNLTLELLPDLRENATRQKSYYLRMRNLSSASQSQKDNAFASALSAKNQYLSAKSRVINLKEQILNLEQKIDSLRDRISKKSVVIKDSYLYKLLVREGEYATISQPLAVVKDLRGGKFILYLSLDELKDIDRKKIYIDGKLSRAKISKIWRVSDEKFISLYRAELILEPKFKFSSLHKVEIK